ncbi:MAG: polysaccharide deacetylase family protein [Rhizobiales bacterium]|nr:polysaccharide deacetylase family protein [Hyphomicrobiales bacterium]
MLKTHGRYAFSAIDGRPDYVWPGGRRLACYVALNLEHYAFGEGLREELVGGGHEPDVLNYSWRDYGNRVAVWRLKALFESLNVPLTLLVNSSVYTHAPGLIERLRSDTTEVSAHGRTNSEAQGLLTEADEAALIREATREIAQREGKAPAGWLGPWLSESKVTPDLVQEAGYRYIMDWCMDDQPVWLKTRSGRILSLPYPQELNDSSTIVGRRVGASDFADMIIDQFDEMLEQSVHQPLVFGLALHPYVIGQPFRIRHLRRALAHIARHREQIWITTGGRIAEHAIGLDQAGTPLA